MSAASEDAVNQATHDEVTRTGIKLEDSKQLELPEKTKTKNAGATSLTAVPTPHETSSEETAPHHEAAPTEAAPAEAEGEVPVTHAKATSKKHAAHKKHAEEPAPEHAAEAETPQEKQQSEALAELHALNEKAKHAAHGKTSGPYTLQIGSYSEMKEAQERVKDLEISGLSPRIHATDIKAKGRWYRIYLGGFATKAAAEKAGGKYRAQGMIDSFIVAKSVE
jgi:cell division protein FtsN